MHRNAEYDWCSLNSCLLLTVYDCFRSYFIPSLCRQFDCLWTKCTPIMCLEGLDDASVKRLYMRCHIGLKIVDRNVWWVVVCLVAWEIINQENNMPILFTHFCIKATYIPRAAKCQLNQYKPLSWNTYLFLDSSSQMQLAFVNSLWIKERTCHYHLHYRWVLNLAVAGYALRSPGWL